MHPVMDCLPSTAVVFRQNRNGLRWCRRHHARGTGLVEHDIREEITGIEPLVAFIAAGEKPRAQWRVGTEHEKFPFLADTHAPVPYDGERSIRALLEALRQRLGWEPLVEDGHLIGLRGANCGKGCITLEPAGQFELSGAPLATIHETAAEMEEHMALLHEVAGAMGIGFLGMGAAPEWTFDAMPLMPKPRYGIMRAYMPKKGRLGLEMMHRTATVQSNLDFGSEADMVQKMRVSLALQPLITALFANSPFTDGKPNGYLSWRSAIWLDTDADRTGMLPFVFDEGFGYEAYVQYALDVPMYFVKREGRYIDASGQSFRDFMEGRLPALPGEHPTIDDWADHLTTLFPEVRLKRFIEMRGADMGSARMVPALSAFWVGLLYDTTALDAAWDVVKHWPVQEMQRLRAEVPKLGLRAEIAGRSLRDVGREVLSIADTGLARRNNVNARGQDERLHLQVLHEIIETGRTQAEELLARYHDDWHGDIRPVYAACAL